jgi:NADPH:quinone reductase-like Zn-dependent oxidoreductase
LEVILSGISGSKHDTARAVYFTGKGSVFIKEEPLFSAKTNHSVDRSEEEVFVESKVSGISHGTEMLFYRGEIPRGTQIDETIPDLQGETTYPLKYGYMNVGRDDEGRKVFAFFPHQDRFYIKRNNLIYLPDSMDDEDAVFIPSLETALAINHDLPLEPGAVVLLCGLGAVGLLTLEIMVFRHYGKIIAVDPISQRRKAAEALGIPSFAPGDAGLVEGIKTATSGRGADWAVNTSSSEAGLQLCIDSLCFGGTVIESSWYGGKNVSLMLGGKFHRNRVSVRSVQVSTVSPALMHRWTKERRMDTVIELVEKIGPKKYITHRFPLDEAETAYTVVDSQTDSAIQVILLP